MVMAKWTILSPIMILTTKGGGASRVSVLQEEKVRIMKVMKSAHPFVFAYLGEKKYGEPLFHVDLDLDQSLHHHEHLFLLLKRQGGLDWKKEEVENGWGIHFSP